MLCFSVQLVSIIYYISIQYYLYSAFHDTIVAKQLYRKLSFYNRFLYFRNLIYLTYDKIEGLASFLLRCLVISDHLRVWSIYPFEQWAMDSHFEQMLSCIQYKGIQFKGNKCKQSIEQKTEWFLLYISITIKLRVEYIAHICSQWSSVWTSHSDGTHSLLHWWASDVMQNFSKSVINSSISWTAWE